MLCPHHFWAVLCPSLQYPGCWVCLSVCPISGFVLRHLVEHLSLPSTLSPVCPCPLPACLRLLPLLPACLSFPSSPRPSFPSSPPPSSPAACPCHPPSPPACLSPRFGRGGGARTARGGGCCQLGGEGAAGAEAGGKRGTPDPEVTFGAWLFPEDVEEGGWAPGCAITSRTAGSESERPRRLARLDLRYRPPGPRDTPGLSRCSPPTSRGAGKAAFHPDPDLELSRLLHQHSRAENPAQHWGCPKSP